MLLCFGRLVHRFRPRGLEPGVSRRDDCLNRRNRNNRQLGKQSPYGTCHIPGGDDSRRTDVLLEMSPKLWHQVSRAASMDGLTDSASRAAERPCLSPGTRRRAMSMSGGTNSVASPQPNIRLIRSTCRTCGHSLGISGHRRRPSASWDRSQRYGFARTA